MDKDYSNIFELELQEEIDENRKFLEELQKLGLYSDNLGFKRIPTAGDGNCWFHVLSMYNNEYNHGTSSSVDFLRREIFNFIIESSLSTSKNCNISMRRNILNHIIIESSEYRGKYPTTNFKKDNENTDGIIKSYILDRGPSGKWTDYGVASLAAANNYELIIMCYMEKVKSKELEITAVFYPSDPEARLRAMTKSFLYYLFQPGHFTYLRKTSSWREEAAPHRIMIESKSKSKTSDDILELRNYNYVDFKTGSSSPPVTRKKRRLSLYCKDQNTNASIFIKYFELLDESNTKILKAYVTQSTHFKDWNGLIINVYHTSLHGLNFSIMDEIYKARKKRIDKMHNRARVLWNGFNSSSRKGSGSGSEDEEDLDTIFSIQGDDSSSEDDGKKHDNPYRVLKFCINHLKTPRINNFALYISYKIVASDTDELLYANVKLVAFENNSSFLNDGEFFFFFGGSIPDELNTLCKTNFNGKISTSEIQNLKDFLPQFNTKLLGVKINVYVRLWLFEISANNEEEINSVYKYVLQELLRYTQIN